MFEAHPAACIFPMLDHEAFERLKIDIGANGQREMIVFLGDKIIDGRNRYKACVELGIDPDTCELSDCDDPVAYVLSKNLHRRQLRISQKAMCAARLATLQVGKPTSNSLNLGNYSADQAAEAFGVSVASIEFARKVLRNGCAELIALCDDDGESVATACNFIDACENKREQSKIAKQGWEAIREKAKEKPKPAAKAKEESPATARKEPPHVDSVPLVQGSTADQDSSDFDIGVEAEPTDDEGDEPDEPPVQRKPVAKAGAVEPNWTGYFETRVNDALADALAGIEKHPLWLRNLVALNAKETIDELCK
jgi:hypothetical protein